MAVTLTFIPFPTGASVNFTPDDVVLPFAVSRSSRNIIHDIIGSGDGAVSFREGGPRTGTLLVLFDGSDAPAAKGLQDAAVSAGHFTLSYPGLADDGMTFVATGEPLRELDGSIQGKWLITLPYREATP